MVGLLGFRKRTILTSFCDVGILFCKIERVNMSVRALMGCAIKCFWYKFEMPFWPLEGCVFCLTDDLTNHLCCEWWYPVCVLGNGVQTFNYVYILSSMHFSQQYRTQECLFSLSACVLSPSILRLCHMRI